MSKNKIISVLLILAVIGAVIFFLYKNGSTPPRTAVIVSESESETEKKKINEIFALPINFTELETTINLGQIDLIYDPSRLKLLDVTFKGSFAKIFVEKQINNQKGFARIVGGLPNPGYKERSGLFATVYFQALGSGETEVEYAPSSLILANDGRGTNVIKSFPKIKFIISSVSLSEEEMMTQQNLLNQKRREYRDKDQTLLFE